MIERSHLVVLLLVAMLGLAGCAETGVAAPDAATRESARINEFFARAFEERLALRPQQASFLGRRDGYDRWDDVSDAGLTKYRNLIAGQLETLTTQFDYDELDAGARLSYDLFIEDANREIEKFRWRHHDYPVNQMRGYQSSIPSFLINVHVVESEADADAYVRRLEGVGPLLASVEEGLATRATLGVIPPKFVFPYVLDDARNVLRGPPSMTPGKTAYCSPISVGRSVRSTFHSRGVRNCWQQAS